MWKTTVLITSLGLMTIGWQQEIRYGAPLKEERVILEHNVTLGEAVVRVEAESEEELERVQVARPDGARLFDLEAPTEARGLSGFKIELQEASLESILASYSEGTYDIRARTTGGKVALGSAALSFDLPPAPRLIYPYDGAMVPASRLAVRWLADRSVSGYHVQMEQGESDGLAVDLPPGRGSFLIPEDFLASGMETQLEIAAIGANGNRTVVEVRFTTL